MGGSRLFCENQEVGSINDKESVLVRAGIRLPLKLRDFEEYAIPLS
jgi:hypothetical protein